MPPKSAAAPPSIEETTPSALDALFPPWADVILPIDKDAGECNVVLLVATHMSCSNQHTGAQVHIRTPLARACLEQQRALWMLGSDQVTRIGAWLFHPATATCSMHDQLSRSYGGAPLPTTS